MSAGTNPRPSAHQQVILAQALHLKNILLINVLGFCASCICVCMVYVHVCVGICLCAQKQKIPWGWSHRCLPGAWLVNVGSADLDASVHNCVASAPNH